MSFATRCAIPLFAIVVCSPPGAATASVLTVPISYDANYHVTLPSGPVDGGIADNSVPFSGGAGSSGTASVQVATQKDSGALVSVQANNGSGTGYASGDASIVYRVILRAADQAAFDAIDAQIGTFGAIGSVSGNFIGNATHGSTSVTLTTGYGLTDLFPIFFFTSTAVASCGASGTDAAQSPSCTAVFGSGALGSTSSISNVPINFIRPDASLGFDPLDFISSIYLDAQAVAGTYGDDNALIPGAMALAELDPVIALASGIRGTLILGDNGDIPNVSAPLVVVAGVPEPGTVALMLGGLAVGGMRRRRGSMVNDLA